jgi:hypothetical protein
LFFLSRKGNKKIQIPLHDSLRKHIESLPKSGLYLHKEAADTVRRRKKTAYLSSEFTEILIKAGIRERRKTDGSGKRIMSKWSFIH